jgi:sugar O-acyltransferase (sialic acid O-acetyltransferase NeuD family)
MKKAIIGAGGFADEVKAHMDDLTMKCFVNDEYFTVNNQNILPLSSFNPEEYEVLVAIGNPKIRKKIVSELPFNTRYFSFIHQSAIILGNDIEIGEGSIVCAGSIITTNCKIGKHSHLNLQTTIGHDCSIGDFFTTAPGTKVSGNCKIGNLVYLGTNSSVREKINICSDVTIGLNSGVVKHINESGIYIGTPSVKIK